MWSDVKMVVLKATRMMRRWVILYKDANSLEDLAKELEDLARQPPRITWSASALVAAPMTPNWAASGAGGLSASGVGRGSDPLALDIAFA